MRREDTEFDGIRSQAFVPGLGHLALGQVGRGMRIMLFALSVIYVMIWRWDRFIGAFSTRFFDRWVASVFLMLLLAGAVWFSRRDVNRILGEPDEGVRGKSPWSVAMRRFRQNRLAVWSIYVILLFYILAILAPLRHWTSRCRRRSSISFSISRNSIAWPYSSSHTTWIWWRTWLAA